MKAKKTRAAKAKPSPSKGKTSGPTSRPQSGRRAGPKASKPKRRPEARAGAGATTSLSTVSNADIAARIGESRAKADVAIEAALDKKGLLPVLIDVSDAATYTDFIAIVSGRSDRQVDAIAEHVVATLKKQGRVLLGREGSGNGRWTLLDFGGVVVHVFYHPVREFYDIESLWIDAPRVKLDVPAEAMHVQEESLFYDQP